MELVKAKILYSSLKQLSKDEMQFLAHRYRKKDKMTDVIAAKEQGLSHDKYRKKRFDIEMKLTKILKEVQEKYQEEFNQEFNLRSARNSIFK